MVRSSLPKDAVLLYAFVCAGERSKELLGQYGIRNVTVYGDTRFDRVLQIREEAKDFRW